MCIAYYCILINVNKKLIDHLGHLLVGEEVLLVLRVLEVVLLEVGPQLLDALGPGRLLLADDVGQLGAELHGLGETGSLGHGWLWGCCGRGKSRTWGSTTNTALEKRRRRSCCTLVKYGASFSLPPCKTGREGRSEPVIKAAKSLEALTAKRTRPKLFLSLLNDQKGSKVRANQIFYQVLWYVVTLEAVVSRVTPKRRGARAM